VSLIVLADDETGADASGFGTKAGMVLGTPRYMSSEQAGGRPVDARSDLFALGTVAYEMLTGRAPFGGETAVHVLHAIMLTSANRASAALPHLEEALRLNPTCRDYIASAAAFAPLRNSNEFAAILAKAR